MHIRPIYEHVRSWGPRQWLSAVGVAIGVLLVTGIPTDLIPTPLFGRPIEVAWWDYPIWGVTAVLAGLLAATYVARGPQMPVSVGDRPKLAYAGGLLSFFAVGCPTCNKIAVLALGTAGASTSFAAIQPILGIAGIALLGVALAVRFRGLSSCKVGLSAAEPAERPAEV